ncbi:Y-family DNA polymerase [Taibaiella chishuiensis]|uniref:Protein ImuB n=1 Tax=Taibaiella chishuiensis TaxID=1434707 RepID=A0A2P8D7Q3_9BACT|nr:DNA polymerase Y family protein [Taibaiella chishuiensis]PSK93227.1 protein ImuB [Taibaiella chishuiensis]
MGRYLSIWLPQLLADRTVLLDPDLQDKAFVLTRAQRGRVMILVASDAAIREGIVPGLVLADARAVLPGLLVFGDKPGQAEELLTGLALWCLRFTPVAAIDPPDGLVLDISGCAHLWGGEVAYLKELLHRLRQAGYRARAAIADTIGAAWALARYGQDNPVISPGTQLEALLALPPAALRLEPLVLERLQKLGLYRIGHFIHMPGTVLRRRFGPQLTERIGLATGQLIESCEPVLPAPIYQERLPCLEPVRTRTAIDIALRQLLQQLCNRLLQERKGLRHAVFKGYRIDGALEQVSIGTNRAVRDVAHLLKLFEQQLATITPALGIELFVLEAPVVEELPVQQETLWQDPGGERDTQLAGLLDRIAGRMGEGAIHRYLPAEHYWPERAIKAALSLQDKTTTAWRTDRPRPVCLLPLPEKITVSVPIPDYPPLSFTSKGQLHRVKKADGPERVECEWWLDQDRVRDYYYVEDEQGARYWLFRSGQYDEHTPEWYLHGYFA